MEKNQLKMYITDGLESRHEGESFGEDCELPSNRAYCETCAAVAWGYVGLEDVFGIQRCQIHRYIRKDTL